MTRMLAMTMAWMLTALPLKVAAEDMPTILIDRRADEVSLYFAMPAPLLPEVFGTGADELVGADGTIDIDRLYDGTFLTADEIFAGVAVEVDGQAEVFEGLSLMVHDPAILPDFATPYDAQISIAVCNSPETVRGMGLAELDAFMGFYAWKVDGYSDVAVRFPMLGRESVRLRVLDFVDLELKNEEVVSVPDGGTLVIGPTQRSSSGLSVAAGQILVLVGLAALALAGVLYLSGRAKGAARQAP